MTDGQPMPPYVRWIGPSTFVTSTSEASKSAVVRMATVITPLLCTFTTFASLSGLMSIVADSGTIRGIGR